MLLLAKKKKKKRPKSKKQWNKGLKFTFAKFSGGVSAVISV